MHFKGLFVRRSKLERGAGAPGLSVKAHGAVAPTGVILTENCISIGSLQNYQKERKAEASEMGETPPTRGWHRDAQRAAFGHNLPSVYLLRESFKGQQKVLGDTKRGK